MVHQLTATGRHLPYGTTALPATRHKRTHPTLTPAMQAGTRFTDPGGMGGWVDLVDLIAPRPGVETATFRSRVRRQTAAPPRQHYACFPHGFVTSHDFCHNFCSACAVTTVIFGHLNRSFFTYFIYIAIYNHTKWRVHNWQGLKVRHLYTAAYRETRTAYRMTATKMTATKNVTRESGNDGHQ